MSWFSFRPLFIIFYQNVANLIWFAMILWPLLCVVFCQPTEHNFVMPIAFYLLISGDSYAEFYSHDLLFNVDYTLCLLKRIVV